MKNTKFASVIISAAAMFALGGCCTDTCKCPLFEASSRPAPQAMSFNDESVRQVSELDGNFAKVAEFMKANDLSKLADGKYAIDGENVFVMVGNNELRPQEGAALEAHKAYADLQYLIEGSEKIGIANAADCKYIKSAYCPKNDIMFFFDGYSDFVELQPGQFVVLMPSDAHAPLLGKGKVRKAVFKIKLGK